MVVINIALPGFGKRETERIMVVIDSQPVMWQNRNRSSSPGVFDLSGGAIGPMQQTVIYRQLRW